MAVKEQSATTERDLFYRDLGQRIAECRRMTNMTQSDLASQIGLSRTSLTNIEKGGQRILADTVFEISFVLGVSLDELMPKTRSVSPIERMESSKRELLLRALPDLFHKDSK